MICGYGECDWNSGLSNLPQLIDHVGTCNDKLRLTPQRWRFAYRQVRIDW